MSGLPKKYAKMGFKKGWRAYKSQNRTVKTPTRRSSKMAKKKTYRRAKSRSRGIAAGLNVGAMIYGGLRQKASMALKPLTSKVPLGTIGDEVVMLAGAHFLGKRASGLTKQIADSAKTVELARIGEAIADGTAFAGLGGMNQAPSNSGYPV